MLQAVTRNYCRCHCCNCMLSLSLPSIAEREVSTSGCFDRVLFAIISSS